MKQLAPLALALPLAAAPPAQAQAQAQATAEHPRVAGTPPWQRQMLRTVSPSTRAGVSQKTLFGDLWQRPDLSPCDRSIVTVAGLIARDQTIELPYHLNLALDHSSREIAPTSMQRA